MQYIISYCNALKHSLPPACTNLRACTEPHTYIHTYKRASQNTHRQTFPNQAENFRAMFIRLYEYLSLPPTTLLTNYWMAIRLLFNGKARLIWHHTEALWNSRRGWRLSFPPEYDTKRNPPQWKCCLVAQSEGIRSLQFIYPTPCPLDDGVSSPSTLIITSPFWWLHGDGKLQC